MARPQTIHFDGREIYLVGPTAKLMKMLEAGQARLTRPERMVLILGEQGMGKTLGCKLFCSRHEDAVHIDVLPISVLRAGRVLQLLEYALGLPAGSRAGTTLAGRLATIVYSLQRHPRMLIFDEAHRLRRYEYMDLLRYIHDEAGCRMAFVSIPAFEGFWANHREFAGRAISYHLQPLTQEETASILPGFSADAAKAIHEISGGRIREVMVLAEQFLANPAATRTPEMIRRAARTFGVRAVA